MNCRRILSGLAATLVLSFAATAHATIIGGGITGGTAGGSFLKLTVPFAVSTPPNTVGDDTFQHHVLYGFDEDQNVAVVGAPLATDVPGTSLAVGTIVASHYIFYDPGPTARIVGFIDFDAPILAIMTETANLAASDYLANTGVTYLNPGLRGLEGGDFATIDAGDPNRLQVDFTASTPGDYIRVLTAFSPIAAAPEPMSLALLGAGMIGLGLARRRR